MANRKPWHCPKCRVELGRVTGFAGSEHLHVWGEFITAVEPSTPTIWLVRCACGCVKAFEGERVHLERRAAA